MHAQMIDALPLHSARFHDRPKPFCRTMPSGKSARHFHPIAQNIAIVGQHITECCHVPFRDHREMRRSNQVGVSKSEDLVAPTPCLLRISPRTILKNNQI